MPYRTHVHYPLPPFPPSSRPVTRECRMHQDIIHLRASQISSPYPKPSWLPSPPFYVWPPSMLSMLLFRALHLRVLNCISQIPQRREEPRLLGTIKNLAGIPTAKFGSVPWRVNRIRRRKAETKFLFLPGDWHDSHNPMGIDRELDRFLERRGQHILRGLVALCPRARARNKNESKYEP